MQRVADETDTNLVLCSPFLVHGDPAVEAMREIAIIKKLADEFGAVWVDFDLVFIAALSRHIPEYWAPDGVHPSVAGHALMADAWVRTVARWKSNYFSFSPLDSLWDMGKMRVLFLTNKGG